MLTTETSSPPIQAISLDLDDTLWPVVPTLIQAEKTLGAWLAINAPATAAHLTAETRKRLRSAVMSEHPERLHDMSFARLRLLQMAMQEAGDSVAKADGAFDVFLAARQQVTLYDDVIPVLEQWHQRYHLIAVSNGNADLDRIGIGHLFNTKISAHEVGFAKPDRRIFELACRRAGIPADSILHVGDDPKLDFEAARNIGMQSVLLWRPDLDKQKSVGAADPLPHFYDLHGIDAILKST
ncbi:MAG: HAD family hydrolase [Burkholderiaceae bacterium]